MDLKLKRIERAPEGIFSELLDSNGQQIAVCLERAYSVDSENWNPKIPNGVFRCNRGNHRLPRMKNTFETFEITGIKGHYGLLFHVGNFNHDSDGCVLLGETIVTRKDGMKFISQSRATFEKFMKLQVGRDEFTITVEG